MYKRTQAQIYTDFRPLGQCLLRPSEFGMCTSRPNVNKSLIEKNVKMYLGGYLPACKQFKHKNS